MIMINHLRDFLIPSFLFLECIIMFYYLWQSCHNCYPYLCYSGITFFCKFLFYLAISLEHLLM